MNSNAKIREEEVTYKKRLLYDGHGSGEDKRLVSLMKNISKFCDLETTNEESNKLYHIISKDLTAALHATERNDKVSQMWDRTFQNLDNHIEEEAEHTIKLKKDLCELEFELKYVQKLREVNEFPDSITTERTMIDVAKRKQELCNKLEKLGHDLKLLTDACQSLRKILNNDEPKQDDVILIES